MCCEDSEVFCMTPRQTKWPCGIPKWHSFSLLWLVVVDFDETYSIGRHLFSDYSCTFQNIARKTIDPDVIWTRNLLIWSQTRYRCATESPCRPLALNRIRPVHNPSLLWIQSAGALIICFASNRLEGGGEIKDMCLLFPIHFWCITQLREADGLLTLDFQPSQVV